MAYFEVGIYRYIETIYVDAADKADALDIAHHDYSDDGYTAEVLDEITKEEYLEDIGEDDDDDDE